MSCVCLFVCFCLCFGFGFEQTQGFAAIGGCYPPSPNPDYNCICKQMFHGPTCELHYFTDRRDLFWSLNIITFLAFLGLFVFSLHLLSFWFSRLVPAMSAGEKEKQGLCSIFCFSKYLFAKLCAFRLRTSKILNFTALFLFCSVVCCVRCMGL
jgi:hypothetical protein